RRPACSPSPSPGAWTGCPTRSARSSCCVSTRTCRCGPSPSSSACRRARSRAGCTPPYGPCAPACTKTRWCDMTAHDEARDPSRDGAGSEYAGPEYDGEGTGSEYAGPEPAHEDTGSEYDGMDALMAALLDEPLPESA